MKLLQALRRSNGTGYAQVSEDSNADLKEHSKHQKRAIKKWEKELQEHERSRTNPDDLPLAPAGSNFHQCYTRPQAALIVDRKVKPSRDNAQVKAMMSYLAESQLGASIAQSR